MTDKISNLTLNSVAGSTKVLIKDNGNLVKTSFGNFIENIIDASSPDNCEHHSNDITLVYTNPERYKVLSVDENGTVSFKGIQAVVKHPIIDNRKTLLKVTTFTGKSIIATKGKSFLTLKENKIGPVKGEELMKGMFIAVSTKQLSCLEEKTVVDISNNTVLLTSNMGKFLAICSIRGFLTFGDYEINYPSEELFLKNFLIEMEIPFVVKDQLIVIQSSQFNRFILDCFGQITSYCNFINLELIYSNTFFRKAFLQQYKIYIDENESNVITGTTDFLQDFAQMCTEQGISTFMKEEGLKVDFKNTRPFVTIPKMPDVYLDVISKIEEINDHYLVYDFIIQDGSNFVIYNNLC